MSEIPEPTPVVVSTLEALEKAHTKRRIISIGRRYDQPGQACRIDTSRPWMDPKLLVFTSASRYFGQPGKRAGRGHGLEHLGVFVDIDATLEAKSDVKAQYCYTPAAFGSLVVGEKFFWGMHPDGEQIKSFISVSPRDLLTPLDDETVDLPPYDPSFTELDQVVQSSGMAANALALAVAYRDANIAKWAGHGQHM